MHPVDVSHSELKVADQCMMQWFFKYVGEMRRRTLSGPLFVGGFVHSVLEEYYNPVNGTERTSEFMLECLTEVYQDSRSSGLVDTDHEVWKAISPLMLSYQKEYEKKDFEPLDVEVNFRIAIFDTELVGFIHGIWDLVFVDKKDKVWIVDHKTAKRFSFGHLEYDPQVDIYSLGGSKVFGERFGGILMNYIRKKRSQSRLNFTRIPIRRTEAELHLIEQNLANKLRCLANPSPERITFTFGYHCNRLCSYLSLCRKLRAGGPYDEFIHKNFSKRVRDFKDPDEGEDENTEDG